MTYTSVKVHELLKEGFDRSPMFNGRIKSLGPRYCPSIEDKINRFTDKERHQIFVEPEGWNTVEYYINGFSTSLPEDIQFTALRAVKGFENVKFFRPGYAIEYDYFPPTQLTHSLETKLLGGLFFAGQINGTTGYEEAASQGLMAGINAALSVQDKPSFVLKRDEAYIGVLVDDLITKGTEEPYRMFTSRAEYRTLLRQDNADFRLTPKGFELGIVNQEKLDKMQLKQEQASALVSFFKSESVKPEEANPVLAAKSSSLMKQSDKVFKIFSRPNITIADVRSFSSVDAYITANTLSDEVIEQAEIQVKYAGYIKKERNNADKINRLEYLKIPDNFDYSAVKSMSYEAREKLQKVRPSTLAQASRISGVSPNDISVLLVFLGR
jgi:tRNA uridine 5-carboxymethylaminomethyl modification enzyme